MKEWCGIMAFMYCTSLTGVCVLKALRTIPKTRMLDIMIAEFNFLLGYIFHIISIVTTAIGVTIKIPM